MAKRATPPEPTAIEATLARIRTPHAAETESDHAALLLYALQDPRRRSFATLRRATGRPETSLRTVASRWCWADRIGRHGPGADRDAAMLWRELYLPLADLWGRAPCDRLAASVRPEAWLLLGVGAPGSSDAPLTADPVASEAPAVGTDGEKPGTVLADHRNDSRASQVEQARLRAQAQEDVQRAAVEAARQRQLAAEADRERVMKVYRNAQRVLEGYLAHLGAQLTQTGEDGKPLMPPGLKPRDLPMILQQHRELGELLGIIQPVVHAGPTLEPSYRVQLATATGGDVLQAMIEDVQEATVVLTGLRDRRGVGLDVPDAGAGGALGGADGSPPVLSVVPDAAGPVDEPGAAAGQTA